MRTKTFKQILLPVAAIALLVLVVVAIHATSGRLPQSESNPLMPAAPASELTFADRQIKRAEQVIARKASAPDGYNMLCAAYVQKARETGDFSNNARAESALKRSFEIGPDNVDGIKLQAALLLTYHRFREALEVARRAQKLQPQDAEVYGLMTDALVELGDYEKADEAANKMVELRPDFSSYARISYLQSLHGNVAEAIEAMRAAVKSASRSDQESLAWCRIHLGDELANAGKLIEAEREYDLALQIFPEYYLALAAKARARASASDFSGAIEFYKRAQQRVPLPDTAIALGDIYTKLGRSSEAAQQYKLVEFIERAGAQGADTYSLQMALFWANHDTRLDDALAIARREQSMRSDIHTSDVLAWCLFKKGQLKEAAKEIEQALRLGTRNAQIYYHAGMIYDGLGDRAKAVKYLKLVFEINPSFDVLQADVAKRALNAD